MKTNKKRNPIATFLVAIGIIALIGALGWYVHNLVEDLYAEKISTEVAERLAVMIEENGIRSSETESENAPLETGDIPSDGEVSDPRLIEMETVEIDGSSYIGILDIPSESLSLPVAYYWDYDKLAVTPCRYSGSYYTNDMVICAHDYGAHFRAIRSLDIGSSVSFTTVGGERIKYIVTNVETIQPTAIDDMIRNSGNSESKNNWDLTLFTCNVGGMTRCAVRCERIK